MPLLRKSVLRLVLLVLFFVGIFVAGRRTGLTDEFSLAHLRATLSSAGSLGVPLFFLAFTLGTLLQLPGLIFVAVGVLIHGRLYGGMATSPKPSDTSSPSRGCRGPCRENPTS